MNYLKLFLLLLFIFTISLEANEKKTNSISLSIEEKNWIKSHIVTLGVEQWSPVVFSNDGTDIDGISGDFTKKIISRTGLNVNIVNKNWNTLLSEFQNKKIDLLPATYFTNKRKEYGLYSDGYFKMKDYIYVKESNNIIHSMKDLNGKRLAIPKGYGTIDKVVKKFPDIKIVLTRDLDDSIYRVLQGEADALFDGQIAVENKINEELIIGLKSIAQYDFESMQLHYFSKIDEPILQSIIQKGLDSISNKEKNEIVSKWIKKTVKHKVIKQKKKDLSFSKTMTIEELFFGIICVLVVGFILYKQYSKNNISNMKLSTFNIVIIMFELCMILFLIFEISMLVKTENKLIKAHLERFDMIQMIDELRYTSDELSHLARNYAVTMDKKYKKLYDDTLLIRSGDKTRPIDYNNIYKEKKSLSKLISELPFSQVEFLEIRRSEEIFKNLTYLEKDAFELLVQGKQQLAIKSLHSDSYFQDKYKRGIVLDEIIDILNNRTNTQIDTLDNKIKNQFKYIIYLGILFILGNIYIYFLLRSKINNPIEYLTNIIKKFQNGDKEILNKTFYNDEIGDMNREFFAMKKLIDSKTQDLKKQLAVVRNTEKKQLDLFNELDKQKVFMQTLLDSQEQIIITTSQGEIESGNETFLDFFAVDSIEEFKKIYNAVCICDTFNQDAPEGYLQKYMNGTSWIEHLIFNPNNSTNKVMISLFDKDWIFSVSATNLPNKEGLKSAVFTDITEIESTRQEIEQVLSNILLPVLITCKKTRKILYANKYAQTQYEMPIEEIVGSSIDVVYTAKNQQSHIIEAINTHGYVENLEEVFKTSTGKEFTALLSVIPITYKNEESYIGMVTDITKQKAIENEIRIIHKHTKESIEYAALIQSALIPDTNLFRKYFKDHFVIWHPKDTVGGDIYLFEQLRDEDECLLMVIDCTGHGVPGAFVTMLVKAVEREVIAKIMNDKNIDVSPAWIMGYFNKTLKKLLKQETLDSISNAGWDGGIIYYNKKTQILKFAGAETPLFYIDENKEFKTIKGNRYSVGYKKCDANYEYKETILNVKEGMKFYCTTDGYLDQNGGEKDFPFGKRRFSNIIKEYHDEAMAEQQTVFLYDMMDYEEMVPNNERNDDMTVVAFEIKKSDSIETVLKYDGVLTQSIIAHSMDLIENNIENLNIRGKISTLVIELTQNMMKYSKSQDIHCEDIKPAGFIEVKRDNENIYYITSKNVLSIEDKQKIEPVLQEIKKSDLAEIKNKYKELRRSGEKTHANGGGIGFYEIAKLVQSTDYKFKLINEKKFLFEFKLTVKSKK